MKQENILNQEKMISQESIPVAFPVVVDNGHYQINEFPKFREKEITNFFQGEKVADGRKLCQFVLSYPVGDLHYLFYLMEERGGGYEFGFKTQEYEFARTELKPDERDILGVVAHSFLESVEPLLDANKKEILVSMANASYTTKEIKECKEKILSSPKNTLSSGEIDAQYTGENIFYLYQKLFDDKFHSEHGSGKSKRKARKRLFQSMMTKYLPDWELKSDPFSFFGNLILSKKRNDDLQQTRSR